MRIDINSDVDKFQTSTVKGFTGKQILFIGIALLIGGSIGILLHFVAHLPLIISTYIAIPFVVPFGLAGFYNRGGMDFFTIVKKIYEHITLPLLVFKSTELAMGVPAVKILSKSERKKLRRKIKKDAAIEIKNKRKEERKQSK